MEITKASTYTITNNKTPLTNNHTPPSQLGMIGAGNMGGMMTLLFAEHGIHVHIYDPSKSTVARLEAQAREAKPTSLAPSITHHDGYESLCASLEGSPRVFVFSVPHGDVADKTIDGLLPFLGRGDVMMDASNEAWTATERRQERLRPVGVHYVGMGVSGGYQSARHGPSISPGGSREALDLVWPFLSKVAAKDKQGRPCTAKLGPGGCGHYVKMVHNGIEHGMMTVLCEVWGIMNTSLGMSYHEIGDVFAKWNSDKDSMLRDNFLVDIGAQICKTKDPKDGSYVLSSVGDKIVQDVDDEEGTGTWTVEQAAHLHVPAPTIAVSHMFRVASAHAERRKEVQEALNGGVKPGKLDVDKEKFLADLRDATYGSFLMSFAQGMHIIAAADAEHNWGLKFTDIMQLWRGGCIIQSDAIMDMLEGVYRSKEVKKDNLFAHPTIAKELKGTFSGLKQVVISGLQADAHVPALSTSLEYYKYSGSTDLPTSFQEAELDYFGWHMFDYKDEGPGKPVIGKHHFEWHPAHGIRVTDEESNAGQG